MPLRAISPQKALEYNTQALKDHYGRIMKGLYDMGAYKEDGSLTPEGEKYLNEEIVKKPKLFYGICL